MINPDMIRLSRAVLFGAFLLVGWVVASNAEETFAVTTIPTAAPTSLSTPMAPAPAVNPYAYPLQPSLTQSMPQPGVATLPMPDTLPRANANPTGFGPNPNPGLAPTPNYGVSGPGTGYASRPGQ